MRDTNGRFLSNDEIDAIYFFIKRHLLYYLNCNDFTYYINSITYTKKDINNYYFIEFTQRHMSTLEITESEVISYIRNKKIDNIIDE